MNTDNIPEEVSAEIVDTSQEVVIHNRWLPEKIPEAGIVKAFEDAWLTDEYAAKEMKDIIDNAVTANPKTGEYYTDFNTKLSALRAWHKMKTGAPDVSVQIANIFPWGNIL